MADNNMSKSPNSLVLEMIATCISGLETLSHQAGFNVTDL